MYSHLLLEHILFWENGHSVYYPKILYIVHFKSIPYMYLLEKGFSDGNSKCIQHLSLNCTLLIGLPENSLMDDTLSYNLIFEEYNSIK
jgi:hypothetical protein